MTHVEFPGLGLAFDVNPVAFTIGSFEFRWYGILIALGFILAFLYALKICKRYQVNQDHLIDCIIAGLIPVSYTHLDVYKRQPLGGFVEQRMEKDSSHIPKIRYHFFLPVPLKRSSMEIP